MAYAGQRPNTIRDGIATRCTIADNLAAIADDLVSALHPLRFAPPVTHVYNPLIYARQRHHEYLRRFGKKPCEAIFVGMNPGPWGMAQTGVPFGEVAVVRDWMGISGPVGKPDVENAARPILGFNCSRSEVSGRRLWGWARHTFNTADEFFSRFFVANYCPLTFMEESGRNRTPDKLPAAEREPLFAACDEALRRTVTFLEPRYVIGVGRFAQLRAEAALVDAGITIGRILHPSPASPAANRGWAAQAAAELTQIGISLPRIESVRATAQSG